MGSPEDMHLLGIRLVPEYAAEGAKNESGRMNPKVTRQTNAVAMGL